MTKSNKTYIKVKWDMSDLEQILQAVHNNYSWYSGIINLAHEEFMAHQNNYELFGMFFKSLIASI